MKFLLFGKSYKYYKTDLDLKIWYFSGREECYDLGTQQIDRNLYAT